MPATQWSFAPPEASPGPRLTVQPKRVLIADDDDDLRQLLAETLRVDGYQVVEAEDGQRLLDLLSSRMASTRGRSKDALDLIICDIRMPGPNGLWALATLQHLSSVIPFVVITALTDPATKSEAQRLGATAVVRKPIDVDRFRRMVQELAGLPPS